MLTTEKEASGKWCPMVRVVTGSDTGAGQALTAYNDVKPRAGNGAECIGSGCMMWRWSNQTNRSRRLCDARNATAEHERPDNVPASWEWVPYQEFGAVAHWIEPFEEAKARRQGYCGLAPVQWSEFAT